MGQDFSIAFFEGEFTDWQEMEDVYNCLMSFVCVFSAAIASGLTIGLMALDKTKLEIRSMIGTEEDRANAASILPLIKQHHLLLVTLMLYNSLANESLPIFLGSLVPNYLAILISVVLVLICGEIVPSALFTGPHQLQIAARFVPFTWLLIGLFYPLAYPLSRVLDYFFGADEDDSSVTRNELEALMVLQSDGYNREGEGSKDTSSLLEPKKRASYERKGSDKPKDPSRTLNSKEVSIMTGILKLSKLNLTNVMINISHVFMIPHDLVLDEKGLSDILLSGFSRIPVYKEQREVIIGFLLVKSLAVVNPSDKVTVGSLFLHQPIIVKPNVGLLEMLTVFREGHRHLALVSEDPMQCRFELHEERPPKHYARVLGMLTLENVLEKILQDEIIDETDDNHSSLSMLNKYKSMASRVITDDKRILMPESLLGSAQHDNSAYGAV